MKACKEKLMVTLALVFSLQALADQKIPLKLIKRQCQAVWNL